MCYFSGRYNNIYESILIITEMPSEQFKLVCYNYILHHFMWVTYKFRISNYLILVECKWFQFVIMEKYNKIVK